MGGIHVLHPNGSVIAINDAGGISIVGSTVEIQNDGAISITGECRSSPDG